MKFESKQISTEHIQIDQGQRIAGSKNIEFKMDVSWLEVRKRFQTLFVPWAKTSTVTVWMQPPQQLLKIMCALRHLFLRTLFEPYL